VIDVLKSCITYATISAKNHSVASPIVVNGEVKFTWAKY
jgi:hypothetical protein